MARMFFNEIEAVKIAQNMERTGIAFYTKAAAAANDSATRDVLLGLADDEKEHLAAFEEIEEQLQAARRDDKPYADEPDIAAYIDRLLETQVFQKDGDVDRLLARTGGDYEALAIGMRAERDAILFYREMADMVDSAAARDAFTRIINEERKHLLTLGQRSEHCENFQA